MYAESKQAPGLGDKRVKKKRNYFKRSFFGGLSLFQQHRLREAELFST